MSRVPFAPRLAAASVCRLAVGAAALVLAIPIERALHGISFQYRYVETTDVAISATLAMLTLGFFATREPRSVKEGSTVWIVGGGASGIAAALGVCALVSCRLQHLRGSLLDLLLGAAGGVLFGMLCSLPARELRAARSDQTHSAQDVQIVNTCAWLCGVVGVSAHFAESVEWLYLAAGIATCALGAMLLATTRYVLRRRWLRRVFAGADAQWETDATSTIASALPALELLPWWSDERTLVRVLPATGAAYRTATRRTDVARVIPSMRI